LGLAALVAASLAAVGGREATARPPAAGSEQPNVVVVMLDDATVPDVRVMDSVRRELTQKGVSFKRFYATFPLCCPSRATYLTGQYAHNHGVVSNKPALGGGFESFDDSATTAVALQQAGYRTALIGKYLNGYGGYAREFPDQIPPGWDRWFATTKNSTRSARRYSSGWIVR